MSTVFTCNHLTVKNTPSLKNREEFEVVLVSERALYPSVVGLEAYPVGTHFKVTIEAIGEATTQPVDEVTDEIIQDNPQNFLRYSEPFDKKKYHDLAQQQQKTVDYKTADTINVNL